jgi:hypothetical protein
MDVSLLPQPQPITVAEKELLMLRRKLVSAPAMAAFRVPRAQPRREFERYSDRYRDAPAKAFSKVR